MKALMEAIRVGSLSFAVEQVLALVGDSEVRRILEGAVQTVIEVSRLLREGMSWDETTAQRRRRKQARRRARHLFLAKGKHGRVRPRGRRHAPKGG